MNERFGSENKSNFHDINVEQRVRKEKCVRNKAC